MASFNRCANNCPRQNTHVSKLCQTNVKMCRPSTPSNAAGPEHWFSTNNGGIQIVHQRVHCGPDVRFFRSVNKLYPHTQREYFENTQHLASGMWWLEASREPANTRNVYTYIHTHTYIYMVSPSPETHVFDFTPTHHQIIVNQNWFNITSLIVATPH